MEVNKQKWMSEMRDDKGLQVNRDHEGLQVVPMRNDASWKYQPEGPRRRILGLSVAIFWVVIVLFVIIVAGAVGGGVVGGLAMQKKNTSSLSSSQIPTPSAVPMQSPSPSTPTSSEISSTSPSTTSSATSGPSPVIDTPCTHSVFANNTVLTATDSTGTNTYLSATAHTFTLLCNTNYPAGAAYGNPKVIDLYRIYTPDMASCIDTCAAYNLGYAVLSGDSPSCVAVAVVKAPGEFCYLKSATGTNDTSSSGGASIDTAILIN